MHKIGYFVNNHGTGHTNRLFCLVQELEAMNYDYKLYVFAENVDKIYDLGLPIKLYRPIEVIKLPSPNWGPVCKGEVYHCLPNNYKEYFKPIVSTCINEGIQTFVSDLSVEVGMAVRLHVDKLVYILLHGDRVDGPHQNMFHIADKLIVPFHQILEDSYFREFSREFNLVYSGGFLKFQYQSREEFYPSEYDSNRRNVLIILGTGGDTFDESYIDVDPNIYNVVILGKKKFVDPYNYIRCADIVVANAGDSIMHEIAYFNKPYICIPEERPFREQEIKGMTLFREGMALTSSWRGLLSEDIEVLDKLEHKDKSILIQNDKANLYANEIINC